MTQQEAPLLGNQPLTDPLEHLSSDKGRAISSLSQLSYPTFLEPRVNEELNDHLPSTNEAGPLDFDISDDFAFVNDSDAAPFPTTATFNNSSDVVNLTPPETVPSSSTSDAILVQLNEQPGAHHVSKTISLRPSSPSGNPISASDHSWLGTLHIAAQKGHLRIVNNLLTKGVSVDEQDDDGRTPLILAAIGGHSAIVKTLLDNNARVDYIDHEGRSAIHWAAIKCNTEILKMLLDVTKGMRGFDVDAYDNMGWTALHLAVERGFEAGMELLLDCGADVNFKARRCPISGGVIPMSQTS